VRRASFLPDDARSVNQSKNTVAQVMHSARVSIGLHPISLRRHRMMK